MTAEGRRLELKNFVQTKFKNENNHCQALVDIYAKACGLVRDIKPKLQPQMGINVPPIPTWQNVADALVNDLEAVLIGTSMQEGRGKGPHFAGNIGGANGFKPQYRDPYNQIQHATAGFVIGYRYGKLGEWFARWVEEESQDDKLYEATCPVGRWLSSSPFDYLKVPDKMRSAIGDNTCLRALPYLLWSPSMVQNAPPTPSLWEHASRRPK